MPLTLNVADLDSDTDANFRSDITNWFNGDGSDIRKRDEYLQLHPNLTQFGVNTLDLHQDIGNNPKAVAAIAQSLGANYKEKFKQAIKDIEKIKVLSYFFYPEFTNVLEKENEDGSKIYIGDLEWSTKYEFIGGGKNKYKQYTTVCICYDNNFNLPHFDLVKEIGRAHV